MVFYLSTKIACCMPFRLSCKIFVKDRFLPPPFGMSQSLNNALTWARFDKAIQDLLLQQAIARSGVIPTFVQRKYRLGNPFNAFHPAVKDNLKKRMCSICRMHFGTIKMISNHHQSCRRVDNNAKSNDTSDVENFAERVRALRNAAIRQREVLCVFWMQEMEWMFLDGIQYNNIVDVPVVKSPVAVTPLFHPSTENVVKTGKTIVNEL